MPLLNEITGEGIISLASSGSGVIQQISGTGVIARVLTASSGGGPEASYTVSGRTNDSVR